MLDAIKAAGYESADMIRRRRRRRAQRRSGRDARALQRRRRGRGAAATPESIAALKQKLAARGLKSNIASPLDGPDGVPVADAIATVRQQIADAQTLGQKYALNLGIEDDEQ